jgi:hypothetical protein
MSANKHVENSNKKYYETNKINIFLCEENKTTSLLKFP